MEVIHHSEERYASLTLVAHSKEEIEQARKVVDETVPQDREDISISDSEVDDIYEITIEYHDDYDKSSGEVFEKIIKSLNIDSCE